MNGSIRRNLLKTFITACFVLFAGCALLKEPGPKLTAAEKETAASLLADWNEQGKGVIMKDRSFGYDPESFKRSQCHGIGLFEKYELDKISEGGYTLGTLAYYCPPEKQYWINQYSGGAVYINRWAGPFDYEPGTPGEEKSVS